MRAASAAAYGSTISRISCSFSANATGGATRAYQSSRSASSRFHTPRGRTRVPIFGRDSTSPFDVSVRSASRITVRLTPYITIRSGSLGNSDSGG